MALRCFLLLPIPLDLLHCGGTIRHMDGVHGVLGFHKNQCRQEFVFRICYVSPFFFLFLGCDLKGCPFQRML